MGMGKVVLIQLSLHVRVAPRNEESGAPHLVFGFRFLAPLSSQTGQARAGHDREGNGMRRGVCVFEGTYFDLSLVS